MIGEAFDRLPPGIARRLGHVHFLCGVDPVFAGLHGFVDMSYGRSYRDTAHCVYPSHIIGPRARRITTVVLPVPVEPSIVVHELAHALDHAIGFDHPPVVPITDYARTCPLEAWAEAFTAWRYWGIGDEATLRSDGATLATFKALAA